jgi:outer membrane protein assembly factor BamB
MGVCAAAFVLATAGSAVALARPSTPWPSFQGGPEHVGSAPDAPGPPLSAGWRYATGKDVALSPAVLAPGAAVFETSGEVVAVDPTTGRRLWSTSRVPGPVAPVAVDPAMDGGLVVYTEGGIGGSATVVAMALSDRQIRWAFTLPRASAGGPTIAAGTVFVGTSDGSVFAIDEESGGQRWRARTDGAVLAPPAVSGGRVFAASVLGQDSASHLYAWDAQSGKVAWDVAQRQGTAGTSAVTASGGRVYVGMGGVVQALDASTGKLSWSRSGSPSGGSTFSPASAPAVVDGSVYVLDAGGHLSRFEASSGDRVWDFLFDASANRSSALVAGGAVYAGLDDGTIGAVAIQSGNEVWRSKPEHGPVGPFAPAGELLLAPHLGRGGSMVALGHTGGALTDIVSPSRLNATRALLNFVVAAVIVVLVAAAIAALMAWLRNRRQEVAA